MSAIRPVDAGIFVGRLVFVYLFIESSLEHFADMNGLYQLVASSHLVPPPLDSWYASALPWWQLAFAACLLFGLFTRCAAAGSFLAVLSYTIYTFRSMAAFGFLGPILLSHNVSHLILLAGIAVAGGGAYSLDARLARRRERGVVPLWPRASDPGAPVGQPVAPAR